MSQNSSATPVGAAALEFESLAALYGPIIETTTDAIVITDARRRIAFANSAAAALFGMPVGRLIGIAVSSLTPAETLEEVMRHETLAFGGEPQWYETLIVRADGERRTVSVSSAPLRTDGPVLGVVASLRDITEERRARDAVVHSEGRYRKLFESATDAIYTLDGHGYLTSANPATCAITGYPVDALLGRSITTLVDPEELDVLRENFRAARAGIPCRYEGHFFRADGERRLASVTNTPIHRGSDVVGVLGIARDITEERHRDAELRRAHTRYQKLVESAWDAIFTVDAGGRFTSLNEALVEGLGIARERLLEMRFEEVVEPGDRPAMQAVHAAALRGERQRSEVRFRAGDGELRIGSVSLTPLVDDGRITTVLGIVRDVTEERRLGEQLLQREKLAAVGQLVSGVAHELNNPLAGVLAFSQLLMATSHPDQAVRDAVVSINKEAKRAAKIISNLLLFARQRPPERTETDLNQVVLDAVELRRYALRTHQIELHTELDPGLPAVLADGAQLQQVILNLITNAEHALRDHSGTKRLTITTSRVRDTLRITVSDNGPGVPEELQDRIFNPFFTTKKVGEGTGLGLSISDGIVREHGGQIRFGCPAGEGAVFVVELPATAPDDASSPSEGSEPLRLLLLAGDSAERGEVVGRLAAGGHRTVCVTTASEALAVLETETYHAVLIDLRGSSAEGEGEGEAEGEALFASLRERHPAASERVVFLTDDPAADAQRRFFRRAGRPVVRAPQPADVIAELLTKEARRT
jgi:PAS domain S-box-containing protein